MKPSVRPVQRLPSPHTDQPTRVLDNEVDLAEFFLRTDVVEPVPVACHPDFRTDLCSDEAVEHPAPQITVAKDLGFREREGRWEQAGIRELPFRRAHLAFQAIGYPGWEPLTDEPGDQQLLVGKRRSSVETGGVIQGLVLRDAGGVGGHRLAVSAQLVRVAAFRKLEGVPGDSLRAGSGNPLANATST